MKHGSLNALAERHGAWAPWLAVIDHVLDASADRQWQGAAPERAAPAASGVPLLHGASFAADAAAVRRLLLALAGCARANGIAARSDAWEVSAPLAAAAFHAALDADDMFLERCARDAGAEPRVFRALALLLPLPVLHGCRRRLGGSLPRAWSAGYCPCCGAWPAHAEVLGIERARHQRCGRCGSSWHAPVLRCSFCATQEHEALGALVGEGATGSALIETCARCKAYLKTFVVLSAAPPEQVLIDDLASVALDIAALTRGYCRPGGVGFRLGARLREPLAAVVP